MSDYLNIPEIYGSYVFGDKEMRERLPKAAYEEVCPAMQRLRSPIDRLEMMVSADLWPVPTYDELLFNV